MRMGRRAFSAEEGYGLEDALAAFSWVVSAEATSVNGGLLVIYEPNRRDFLLDFIGKMEKPPKAKRENNIKELEREFACSISKIVARHFLQKLLLPAPVRAFFAVFNAAQYVKKGLKSLQRGNLDVDVLDAAAVTAALAQKDFATAASIITLLRVSELLEGYTRKKTRQTLSQSLFTQIDKVWLVGEERDVRTPMAKVQIGDLLRVRAGSAIPLDGEVSSGEAIVNESSLTGEALGVLRKTGHSVYAGTVVEEGSLVVKVRTLADDTRIQSIAAFIERSESLKATTQGKAEKLADAIVPFSFLGFGLVFAFTGSLSKALSILMVDYSCAIKLTTPMCIISAMREAANSGILVKGGIHLEAFANADTIVFDKTGTLTNDCPRVAKVVPFDNRDRDELLKTAACLEEHFPHSVARAIVRQAEVENLNHEEEHADVDYIVAHGISSMLNGERILIGSHHFIFEDEGVPLTPEQLAIMERETPGYSVVWIAINNQAAGMICVEDTVREDAAEVLAALRKQGIRRIIMLTGDGNAAAKSVCETLGIDTFRAQMLPEEKADYIHSLKSDGHQVIMVGDGINDSPALSGADVSVVMKSGSDIAKAVADISLLTENLNGLVELRTLSQSLFSRIHRNYAHIIAANSTLLFLGAFGLISASSSALLHNISTMVLCGASMRTYRK